MDFMIMFFSICSVIGIGILIWFKTKSGKRWLANLWCGNVRSYLYRWNSRDGCIYDLAKNKIRQEMAR